MTPEKFVQDITEEIVNQDLLDYKKMLNSTIESPDKYWQAALNIYIHLPAGEKEYFLGFIRLIMVNTVSHFLGILDGTSFLNEDRDRIILTDKLTNERLNNFLQDIFLEMEERHD